MGSGADASRRFMSGLSPWVRSVLSSSSRSALKPLASLQTIAHPPAPSGAVGAGTAKRGVPQPAHRVRTLSRWVVGASREEALRWRGSAPQRLGVAVHAPPIKKDEMSPALAPLPPRPPSTTRSAESAIEQPAEAHSASER